MDIDKVKEARDKVRKARNVLKVSVFYTKEGTLRYKDAVEGIYKATQILDEVLDDIEETRVLKTKLPFISPGYNSPQFKTLQEKFLVNKINELEERVQKVEKE